MKTFAKIFPWLCLTIYACICIFAPLALVMAALAFIAIVFFDFDIHAAPRWGRLPSVKEARKRVARIRGQEVNEPRRKV